MQRDTQDLVGGVAMTTVGLFASLYAGKHYEVGELASMGAGYVPVLLGGVLAVLGAAIAVPAWFRKGAPIPFEWRNALYVLAGLGVFGASLEPLGLVLAALLSALVSSRADRSVSWRSSAAIAAGIAVLAYLIFHVGLSMMLPIWPWST